MTKLSEAIIADNSNITHLMLSVTDHPEKALLAVGFCQGRQGEVVQPAFNIPVKLAPVQIHEKQPRFPEKK